MKYTLKYKEIEYGYDVLRIRHFEAENDLEAAKKVVCNVDVGFEYGEMAESGEFDFKEDWTPEHICEYIEDCGYLTNFELKNDTTQELINEAAFFDETDEKTVEW